MVKFLLDAGADQEHKTDEMHTALMEASMDGHVEVAKLLLDHGAQVYIKLYIYKFYLNSFQDVLDHGAQVYIKLYIYKFYLNSFQDVLDHGAQVYIKLYIYKFYLNSFHCCQMKWFLGGWNLSNFLHPGWGCEDEAKSKLTLTFDDILDRRKVIIFVLQG